MHVGVLMQTTPPHNTGSTRVEEWYEHTFVFFDHGVRKAPSHPHPCKTCDNDKLFVDQISVSHVHGLVPPLPPLAPVREV